MFSGKIVNILPLLFLFFEAWLAVDASSASLITKKKMPIQSKLTCWYINTINYECSNLSHNKCCDCRSTNEQSIIILTFRVKNCWTGDNPAFIYLIMSVLIHASLAMCFFFNPVKHKHCIKVCSKLLNIYCM